MKSKKAENSAEDFCFIDVVNPLERIALGKVVLESMSEAGLWRNNFTLDNLKQWVKDEGVQKAYERINIYMEVMKIPHDIRESQRMVLEYIETTL